MKDVRPAHALKKLKSSRGGKVLHMHGFERMEKKSAPESGVMINLREHNGSGACEGSFERRSELAFPAASGKRRHPIPQ